MNFRMYRVAHAVVGIGLVLVISAALILIDRARSDEEAQKETSLSITPTIHMLTLTSSAFKENELIPSKYTCDGDNVSPALSIEGVPEDTKSLALLMDDPDIPDFVKEKMHIEKFDHYVLYNIPADTKDIAEDSVPDGATVGANGSGKAAYTGPCPPDREHRYLFKLYALSDMLDLKEGATMADVESAMDGKILGTTTLIGRYARTGQ